MSVLLVIESLDPTAVPLPGELAACVQTSWNLADPRRHGGSHTTSGHSLALSQAEFDAPHQQIKDALAFLLRHGHTLRRRLGSLTHPRGELIFAACISPPAVAQEISLPAELIVAAGNLGLALSLRTYLADDAASGG